MRGHFPCGQWGGVAALGAPSSGKKDARKGALTRLGSSADAGKALANSCVVVLFLAWRLHQLVVDAGRNIVILANFSAGELDFQGLAIFLVTNLVISIEVTRIRCIEKAPLSQGRRLPGKTGHFEVVGADLRRQARGQAP